MRIADSLADGAGTAAELVPWLLGGLGLLFGAVIAAVVIHHRPRK
ncbi:hypothetical protein [Allosalinactinospora lopnorensis]|nr:hypothetical protein [Allosalinactinospora lopnorensis]